MKTTTKALTGAAILGSLLVGPAAAASAAEKPHHETRAEKKADRIHDRRVARRAAKAAPKPPQDTTTTGVANAASTGNSPTRPPVGSPSRGVVSCGVSGDRAGASFTVTNTCPDAQTIAVSIQHQPGVWHVGLCQQGGCSLVTRYAVTVQPGTHTIGLDLPCGYSQADLKHDGRLVKSLHWFRICKPTPPPVHPKPRPPVQTHPRIPGHVEGHHPQPTADLPRTGGVYTAGIEGGLALLFLGGVAKVAGRKRSA